MLLSGRGLRCRRLRCRGLQHSPNMLLIPGTSSVDHLRENIAGAALALPPDALAELDAI